MVEVMEAVASVAASGDAKVAALEAGLAAGSAAEAMGKFLHAVPLGRSRRIYNEPFRCLSERRRSRKHPGRQKEQCTRWVDRARSVRQHLQSRHMAVAEAVKEVAEVRAGSVEDCMAKVVVEWAVVEVERGEEE